MDHTAGNGLYQFTYFWLQRVLACVCCVHALLWGLMGSALNSSLLRVICILTLPIQAFVRSITEAMVINVICALYPKGQLPNHFSLSLCFNNYAWSFVLRPFPFWTTPIGLQYNCILAFTRSVKLCNYASYCYNSPGAVELNIKEHVHVPSTVWF